MSFLRIALVVVLAAAAVSALAATGAAQAPEEPDPQTLLPPVPREVGDRLPTLQDLQQRHPWQPNDAPWPWNMSLAQGSWTNSNGSITLVYCGPTVASQNPNWQQEDLRYTQYSGGARCNVQMRAITGVARLHQWNGIDGTGAQLAQATIGSLHEVPEGHGSGWQAYAAGYYTRTDVNQNLQIHLSVTLEIQPWGTGARWNTVPNSCTRDANIRIIHCQLWSPPFRFAPYPCPSGKAGVQPLDCTSESELDSDLGEIEEANDNYADGVPDQPVPDPEAEADYAACGEGDDESSCLDNPPAAAQEASCEPNCAAFYVGPETQAEEVPEWVQQLDAYRDFSAIGIAEDVMFYESGAVVGYPSSTRSTRTNNCPRRYVCVYQHVGFRYSNGYFFATSVNGSFYDLDNYGMNNRVSSWRNKKTARDAHLQANEMTPAHYCMRRRHAAYRIGSWNDKADYLAVFGSSNQC